MNKELNQVLTTHGFVAVADAPQLRGIVKYASQRGEIVRLLPGIWVPAAGRPPWQVVAAATLRFDQDAVICRDAAAALVLGYPPPPGLIEAASPHKLRPQSAVRFIERRVDPDFVVLLPGGIRCTSPALTAVDLAATDSGNAVDAALRLRRATLSQIGAALESGGRRRGNTTRREIVTDSADLPWSQAERLAHRLLRDAKIRGWRANGEVWADGYRYYGDIVFAAHRLICEIDGREHHHSSAAFEADRRRQNDLVLAGWTVLRFTWAMLADEPGLVVEQIRTALDGSSHQMRGSIGALPEAAAA